MKNCVLLVLLCAAINAGEAARPNIIFILTDDLGIGDIGVFFQNARRDANKRSEPFHATPMLDAMANDGIQLRHHYCPAPVCAPSRASLMLGVHQGHANIRNNQFDKALEQNHTVASVLKQGGYATACIGKWGLQGAADKAAPNGFPAHPMNRGFDYYFGYIAHKDGHAHFPKEDGKALYDGAREVSQDYDKCYTTDLFTARSQKFIADHRAAHPGQPFFLYLAYDTPHAKLQLPSCPFPAEGLKWLGKPGQMINTATGTPDSFTHPDYASATWDHDKNPATPEQAWPDVYKRYAAGVRRIDDCVGDLIRFLKEAKIDDNTLVVFTSDNGPSVESYLKEPYSPVFFGSYGPHDGIKRDLWEGGIRVGAIARWPKMIPAKRVSEAPSAFWDWLPTFAEAAGVAIPARTDGVSLLPTLSGAEGQQPSRIYHEYFVGGKTPDFTTFDARHRGRMRQQMQSLRLGDFKGVRYNVKSHSDDFEIYDVVKDPKESSNFAGKAEFAKLQQEMKDTVLRLRRPDEDAKRPYDDEAVPAVVANPAEIGLKSNEAANSFTGYIQIPKDGDHTFYFESSGHAVLKIHDACVIDLGFKSGAAQGTIKLKAGWHPVKLSMIRSRQTELMWSGPGIEKSKIPPAVFKH